MSDAEFRQRLTDGSLSPLWDVMDDLLTEWPTPRAKAHCWHYAEIRPLLMEAGDLIDTVQAERRVLVLENPGIPNEARVTDSLYAGIQLVHNGESARVHRHSQSALRFVMEGEKVWTSVDGERVYMQPFDLVLTSHWRWHEHGGDGLAIWLDGLDIPIVQAFAAAFAEREGNAPSFEDVPVGSNVASFGANMRPVGDRVEDGTPLFHFPYSQWRPALEAHSKSSDANAHLGWIMEFINPANAGSVLSTISAFSQKVPAGMKTKARRQSDGAVYCGVEGSGALIVDGKRFEIGPRDLVAVPSWTRLEVAAGDDGLILFNYSDRTCQEKLGLWREERE